MSEMRLLKSKLSEKIEASKNMEREVLFPVHSYPFQK